MTEPLTIAALAGLITPVLTAILTQVKMRGLYKRLIAIAVALILVSAGLLAVYQPHTWQAIASALAAAIGVTQVVYTAMKPVWDVVELRVNPGPVATD